MQGYLAKEVLKHETSKAKHQISFYMKGSRDACAKSGACMIPFNLTKCPANRNVFAANGFLWWM